MVTRIVSPPLKEIDKLRQPLTPGERLVLNYFLENLPESWEIYIQPHLNGLRPDFVLLHPEKGIAVYEVKDWDLDAMDYFIVQTGQSSPRLMARREGISFSVEKQNPVPKIDLYKEEIYSLYCPRLPSGDGFGSIVSGIIFPFAREDQVRKLLEPFQKFYGHDKYPSLYPIVGCETISDQGRWMFKKKVLPSVYKTDDRMSSATAYDLRHWLVEPEFSAEQRRPLLNDLSSVQREFVTTRTGSGYRRIRGPAGSGKTFVLAGRAALLASEGKRVLVVTFNITLINYILDMAVRFTQSGKVRTQIDALNFHTWCKRVSELSGHYTDYKEIWRDDAGSEGVLKNQLANAAREWLKDLDENEKWDAILVDEGQDFELPWWVTLRKALRAEGEALLVADRVQNIYEVTPWTEEEMTGAGFRGKWSTLDSSYRLPPALCDLAREFIKQFFPNLDAQNPEPENTEIDFNKPVLKWWQIKPGHSAQNCVDALMEIVNESNPPIAYADLTCIVENESIGLEVVRLLRENGVDAIHTFGKGGTSVQRHYDGQRKKQAFFKGDARIKVTTLHSFKGWESKALVVQVAYAKSNASLALVYSGITRLKRDDFGCYLTVVCEAPELIDYAKKWPIYRELAPGPT